MEFIKDSLITFSTQITGVILGTASSVIIARVLGPSNTGIYSLVILMNTIITMIGNSGIAISNIYFGRSKKHNIIDLAANSIAATFFIGVPLTVLFLIYYFLVHPSFLAVVDFRLIIVGCILIPVTLIQTYFVHILLGQNRIKAYNLNNLIQNFVFVLLIFLVLFVFKGGLYGAILSWATSLLLGSILALIQVRRTTPLIWNFSRALFIESFTFGIKGHLGNMMQTLNYRLNMFIIAFYMTIASVGYFSVSTSIANMLLLLPGAVGTVILVQTPGLTAVEANKSTPMICRTALLITIILGLLLFAVAKPVILILFGSEYLPALIPLYILLPGVVLATFYRVLSNEMVGRGMPIVNTIIAGISLIATVSLNMLLVPKMGLNGAALASTLTFSLSSLTTLILFKKISGNSFSSLIVITKSDLTLYLRSIRIALSHNIKNS